MALPGTGDGTNRDIDYLNEQIKYETAVSRFTALPQKFPAALIVQMHLHPERPSVLVELLRPSASLPVEWAAKGGMLRPGTMAVVPPGQHVQVSPFGTLSLTSWAPRGYTRPRCDDLFASVAASFGARALGVVLTALVMVRGVAQLVAVPQSPPPHQPYRQALRTWEVEGSPAGSRDTR